MWRTWTSSVATRPALAGAVLVLAACSTSGSAPIDPPLVEPAALLPPASEQALLDRYPRFVSRTGRTLKVTSHGSSIDYVSKCEQAEECAVFHLDQAFLGGRLFGIAVGYYEGLDYFVADTQSVHECTGGPPIFSPDGQHFAVAVYNEAYETCGEGVAVWATDPMLQKIRTISPRVLTYPDGLRWRGNDCIEFTAIIGDYDEAARRTFYLVKAQPEWRLEMAPSGACKPAA